ncbi:MAG: PEP-CTERM sorting domain-containing protein, partial [Verrucomicrobiota bacterium]|nr:PEP-CTERM sorting domain-containing protein [Verrucomicrobiota bacterium]
IVAVSVVTAAEAQSIVAEYNFTAGTASVDTDITSTATPLTDVGLTATINATVGNPFPSSQAIAEQITNSASTPAGPAPTSASTDYYTFTLTPIVGVSLDFTTLRLDAATLTTVAVGTANSYSISLQTSLNNYTTNVGSFTVNNTTAFANLSFDLSSFAATTGTTPVEFRIVIRDDNASTVRGLLIDNVVLSANVVPEPATYMLMGIGVLVCAQQFRRKKN